MEKPIYHYFLATVECQPDSSYHLKETLLNLLRDFDSARSLAPTSTGPLEASP